MPIGIWRPSAEHRFCSWLASEAIVEKGTIRFPMLEAATTCFCIIEATEVSSGGGSS